MHDFTILVLSNALSSSVALTLDILTATAAMAPRVGVATPRWQVRAFTDGPISLSNGLYIATKPMANRVKPDNSIWIIPGLGTNSVSTIDIRLAQPDAVRAIKALRQKGNADGIVAASCSAVFLLQAAGLLKNRKVTTTLWLAAHLQNIETACIVDANRLVIADGNIWTAGAALAHTDLMLQLVRNRFGMALADAVSRVLLIDGREAQATFIAPAMLSNSDDFIAQLSRQIDATLPLRICVADMAAQLCISERTLARRVKAATGYSTTALIQFVRLKRARVLLETSNMSVEQVSENIGYHDATALRRLMRKVFGVSPRQLRSSIRRS